MTTLLMAKPLERVSPIRYHSSQDENLLNALETNEALKESNSDAYKTNLKMICERIRISLGVENVVGMYINNQPEEKKSVTIFEYPLTATDDRYYEQFIDHEKNRPYIEV